ERFADPHGFLVAAREPETNLHRAQFDQVAIAQHSLLDPLTIDDRQRLATRDEEESLASSEGDLQVAFPHAILVERESGARLATDSKRKTADHDVMARLFAGKDLELNHNPKGMAKSSLERRCSRPGKSLDRAWDPSAPSCN